MKRTRWMVCCFKTFGWRSFFWKSCICREWTEGGNLANPWGGVFHLEGLGRMKVWRWEWAWCVSISCVKLCWDRTQSSLSMVDLFLTQQEGQRGWRGVCKGGSDGKWETKCRQITWSPVSLWEGIWILFWVWWDSCGRFEQENGKF